MTLLFFLAPRLNNHCYPIDRFAFFVLTQAVTVCEAVADLCCSLSSSALLSVAGSGSSGGATSGVGAAPSPPPLSATAASTASTSPAAAQLLVAAAASRAVRRQQQQQHGPSAQLPPLSPPPFESEGDRDLGWQSWALPLAAGQLLAAHPPAPVEVCVCARGGS